MPDIEGNEGPIKKEAAVLSEASLTCLATEMREKPQVLAMYLNIPNTTVVNMSLAAKEKGHTEAELTKSLLDYWKNMRATAKERDKVHDLERACRSVPGKEEVAEIIAERHRDNQELTSQLFAQ